MSKRTVHRIQCVMRTIGVFGWLVFIGAMLACMGGFCAREVSAIAAAGGLLAFTLGVVFGGCLR